MSHNITPAQAKRELARRALPKGDPARAKYPAQHIMQAASPALRAITQAPAPAKKAPAPKAPKVLTQAQRVSRLVTRAAQAQAAAVEGPGYVARVINARRDMLSAGDLKAQAQAAADTLRRLRVQV